MITNNKYIITGIFMIAMLVFNACKKNNETTEQEHQPVISFISPVQSEVADERDTLWIRVNISSEDDLHEYLVEVKNTETGNVVYSYEGHSHDKSVSTNLYFMPDVSEDAKMQLTVTTLDHNSNKTSKSITFTISNTVASVLPSITITAPSAAMYDNGETVFLKGLVSHIRELKEVKVELTQNNKTVFSYLPVVSGLDSMRFDTSYIINSPAYSDFEFVVTATDINDNRSVKTHAFHVHP
jgi:hypothetical protein